MYQVRFVPLSLVLTLAGALGLTACRSNEAMADDSRGSPQRVEMAVTVDGFVPARVPVKVGKPVTVVVTRKLDRTCATEIVIKDYGINKPLPRDKPVEVTFTPTKRGNIHFACAMDMITGEFVAE